MNKFILSVLLTIVSTIACFGQTYCYRYLYNVDSNGVKKEVLKPNTLLYVTFANNGNTCYESNKNGVTAGGYTYKYECTQNNIITYKTIPNFVYNGYSSYNPNEKFYFSSDFSRLNADKNMSHFGVYVFEFTANPQEVVGGNTPPKLY